MFIPYLDMVGLRGEDLRVSLVNCSVCGTVRLTHTGLPKDHDGDCIRDLLAEITYDLA
jgi:hypothetical protein